MRILFFQVLKCQITRCKTAKMYKKQRDYR